MRSDMQIKQSPNLHTLVCHIGTFPWDLSPLRIPLPLRRLSLLGVQILSAQMFGYQGHIR